MTTFGIVICSIALIGIVFTVKLIADIVTDYFDKKPADYEGEDLLQIIRDYDGRNALPPKF